MNSDEFAALRHQLGLTQEQLAEQLGTHQPNIARIERGARQPTVQLAAALRLLVALRSCQQNE